MKNLYWLSVFGATALWLLSLTAFASDDGPVFPDAYINAVPGDPDETPFWERFDEPTLTALVQKGLRRNYDLQALNERIRQSESLARQSKSSLLPRVSAEASWSIRQFDSVGPGYTSPATEAMMAAAAAAGVAVEGGETPATMQTFIPSLKASWGVDITGRNYLTYKASQLDVTSVKSDGASLATSLATAIADAYFGVAVAKVRLETAEEQIATSQDFLELVEARFDTGSATALDVLQQRQQLEAAKGRLPQVRQLLETSRQQLAVLLGTTNLSDLPEIDAVLPEPSPLPPTGDPERLLTARPELRGASVKVRALVLREKAAFRTLLPSFAVSGQVGYQINHSEETDHGETWSLAALLSIPLYQGGGTKSALELARASTRAEILLLQQAAIKAVGEVESALIRDKEQQAYMVSINQQLETSKTAFEEAKARYTVGLSDYLNVLTALATHQTVQLTWVQAHLDWVSLRIALLSALGGDWSRALESAR